MSAYPKLNVNQGGGPLQGQPVHLQGSSGSNPPPRGNGGSGGGGGSGGFNRNTITQNCQHHHIIPQQLSHHPLLKAAGFNIHSYPNRIFLPKPGMPGSTAPENAASMTPAQRAELPWQQRRAFHQGPHDKGLVQQIEKKMTGIMRQGEVANWTQTQYKDKLRGLMAEYRQELKQGNVALNSHHREWATRVPKPTR